MSPPSIGVDSYSYHRLLGEVRPGERPATPRWGTAEVLAEVADLGVGFCSLEICFVAPEGDADVARRAAQTGITIALAWGHRDGLSYGRDRRALEEAGDWVRHSSTWGATIVRVVAASPWVQRRPGTDVITPTVAALDHLTTLAADHGVVLVLENHADLTAIELETVLDAIPGLALCLDTANALRVGDDPVAVARRLAGRTAMVHLKDVEPGGWRGPTGPASVAYGSGAIDVAGVVDELVVAGFAGPICIELGHLGGGDVDERAMVGQCVDWLHDRLAG